MKLSDWPSDLRGHRAAVRATTRFDVTYDVVKPLRDSGLRVPQIAKRLGCGPDLIYRVLRGARKTAP